MKLPRTAISPRYLIQSGWLILALACVVGLGFVYVQTLSPTKHLIYQNFSTKHIDSFLTDLTLMQFNTDGQLIQHLNAPLMQHIPEKNTYLLEKPHLIISEANQAPWEIQADKARAHAEESIILKKHVVIQQKQSANKEAITLTTEKMTYFPHTKLASTSKAVTITQAENQVKAIGMRAYLLDNKIELLSHVRGHYEPRKADAKT